MRTTLDLPEPLLRRAKLRALQAKVTLRTLVATALERELSGNRTDTSPAQARLPVVASRKPGALDLTPAAIEAILAREEAASYDLSLRR